MPSGSSRWTRWRPGARGSWHGGAAPPARWRCMGRSPCTGCWRCGSSTSAGRCACRSGKPPSTRSDSRCRRFSSCTSSARGSPGGASASTIRIPASFSPCGCWRRSRARGVRRLLEWRRSVRITYPTGRVVTAPSGFTILDASRLAGVPHASVCGGRGRCSTCRVRVLHGLHDLPAPSEAERRVLARVGAAPDVRLACQTRPLLDVAVEPLLAPSVPPAEAFGTDVRQGHEQELAVLFADLRGFTRMAEHKLPYDVVFVLNRYFQAVGTAITGAGGVTNQFTGDGVMALFGIESGPATGARQALTAARAMVEGVAAPSCELAGDLPTPLRIGIGIHAGPAVVARMGWGESLYLTAVGDTVHVAARLEQATKDYGAELVVSEDAARHAALDLSAFPGYDLAVRNRAGRVGVRVIERVVSLPVV